PADLARTLRLPLLHRPPTRMVPALFHRRVGVVSDAESRPPHPRAAIGARPPRGAERSAPALHAFDQSPDGMDGLLVAGTILVVRHGRPAHARCCEVHRAEPGPRRARRAT